MIWLCLYLQPHPEAHSPQAQALYLSSQRCMWGSFPIQLPLLRIFTPQNSHICAWIHTCTSTHMQICITNRWTYAHTCIDSCVHTVNTHMHPECTCTAYACAHSHTHACTSHLVNSSSLHKCPTLFIREVAHDLTVEQVSFFLYAIKLTELCWVICASLLEWKFHVRSCYLHVSVASKHTLWCEWAI